MRLEALGVGMSCKLGSGGIDPHARDSAAYLTGDCTKKSGNPSAPLHFHQAIEKMARPERFERPTLRFVV